VPFDPNDRADLLEHFGEHGKDFGAATPEEYEAMADGFMNRQPVIPPLYECIRPNGMICRYDSVTEEYGIKYTWGYIATYFKPVAAGHLPKHLRPVPSHGFRTNMEYFRQKCN
jgi:pyocin large subunit-like protein